MGKNYADCPHRRVVGVDEVEIANMSLLNYFLQTSTGFSETVYEITTLNEMFS